MPRPTPPTYADTVDLLAAQEKMKATMTIEVAHDDNATMEVINIGDGPPPIPKNGLCPHCKKVRFTVDKASWSLYPDWQGCKWCLQKLLPDKTERMAWVKDQRSKMKDAGIKTERAEQES